jgi:hypothetical protein
MARAAHSARTAAPRVLRLVAAGGPAAFDGEIRFHSRLTVLADARPALADWVTSLLGVHAAPDTLLELDDIPARTYDIPRALRALVPLEPLRPETLRSMAVGCEAPARASARGERGTKQIAAELARWEKVRKEARARLAKAHDAAPRVDPGDLAEASRLRNEWRYAVHVDAHEQRRRTRRETSERRDRYEEFLEHFGATSYEDLSMVGTGFGDTTADAAIREAATVVSMAEQRCLTLRLELDEERRAEALAGNAVIAAEIEARAVDLAEFEPAQADRLIARALSAFDDTAYVRPLVADRVLDAFSPAARRRGYERLLAHARRRQIVLITACEDVARWAAQGAPDDVALRMDFASFSRAD